MIIATKRAPKLAYVAEVTLVCGVSITVLINKGLRFCKSYVI
jgi:hypothetical protein